MNRKTTIAKRIRYGLILGLLLFGCNVLSAQEHVVSGRVTSASGDPLPGVTVTVKNGKAVTTTDGKGYFRITVPSSDASLVLTSVGYKNKEVTAGTGSLAVDMESAEGVMTDVVVIGYGVARKSDLTGAITSLKAKDLTPGANVSVEQALSGRVPGVQIYQKSGEPGASMSVKVRGISSITGGNDPLYVIDGMPVNNVVPVGGTGDLFPNQPNPRNPLNSLNPADAWLTVRAISSLTIERSRQRRRLIAVRNL